MGYFQRILIVRKGLAGDNNRDDHNKREGLLVFINI